MTVHSQYVNGNLVWYENNRARWLDAVGADVTKYLDDFHTFNTGDWTITEVGAGGTEALTDGAGGLLLLTTDALDDDSIEMQKVQEGFLLASGKECYFGIRLKVSEATESDFLVGLCITDTDLIDGMTEGVYFRKDDGDAYIDCVTETGGAETESSAVGTLTANTNVILEFYFDGTAVNFLINGTLVATHTAGIPATEELTLSMAYQNGAANAKTMTVDWIRAIQINT
jgi:hypothetical protein